jgi:Mg2+-importing ATPase
MATQILVIFIIRTNGRPWSNPPHPILTATTLAALAVAIVLPFSGVGPWFGFAGLHWPIVASIVALVAVYLVMAELAKPLAVHRERRRPRAGGQAA